MLSSSSNGRVIISIHTAKRVYAVFLSMHFVDIGTAADGTEAQGRILIPEVAHDTEIDDYVVSMTGSRNYVIVIHSMH